MAAGLARDANRGVAQEGWFVALVKPEVTPQRTPLPGPAPRRARPGRQRPGSRRPARQRLGQPPAARQRLTRQRPARQRLTPQRMAPLRLTAPGARGRRRLVLLIGAVALAAAMSVYALSVAAHPAGTLLGGYDLRVYRDAGLITRHDSARLYAWQLVRGIRFTYTPFAALVFAAATVLPWIALKWAMAGASILALLATVWMTFGALGWRGRARLGIVCAIGAVAFWTEPVQRTLHLGQVELLLMVLVVWDLRQPSRRWWQGAGIGLAAGIKLVPLIFIPYLVLTGRFRQATVAVMALAATVAAGWAALPQASASWWLGPDFLRAGRTGFVGFVANQSLRGVITRLAGGVNAATPAWLAISAAVFVLGLTAAALLHYSGRTAQGWVACALTGLLVSPISWDHHWVWIAPGLAVLADQAVRARGQARWSGWALLAALALVFGAWPSLWRSHAALVPWGLIWYAPGTSAGVYGHVRPSEYHWHGFTLLAGNLYILAGLALFALIAVSAARAWRPRCPGTGRPT
jgi:Glycosyltransferase family 87